MASLTKEFQFQTHEIEKKIHQTRVNKYSNHFMKMVSYLANSRAEINKRDFTRSQPLEYGNTMSMTATAWKIIIEHETTHTTSKRRSL